MRLCSPHPKRKYSSVVLLCFLSLFLSSFILLKAHKYWLSVHFKKIPVAKTTPLQLIQSFLAIWNWLLAYLLNPFASQSQESWSLRGDILNTALWSGMALILAHQPSSLNCCILSFWSDANFYHCMPAVWEVWLFSWFVCIGLCLKGTFNSCRGPPETTLNPNQPLFLQALSSPILRDLTRTTTQIFEGAWQSQRLKDSLPVLF